MKKYISNPEIGEIDFKRDFTFEFSTIIKENPTLDDTDFELNFSIGSDNKYNAFMISNILGNPYRSKDSKEFTLKNTTKDGDYLSDHIIFVNGKPYKNLTFETEKDIKNYYILDGVTYVLTSKYEIYPSDTKYIRRWNDKNENGIYVRPAKITQSSNGVKDEISYFADEKNIFDTNYTRRFRISVTDNGKLITLWGLKAEKLSEIKTFRFTNSIDKGKVKLNLDANMVLSDLRFSFFEA